MNSSTTPASLGLKLESAVVHPYFNLMKNVILISALLSSTLLTLGGTGCMHSEYDQFKLVPKVDLEKYMGRWYVLAHSPNRIENEAYNSVEHYALRDDGDVDITFTFREGGFDGEEEVITQHGYVIDRDSNAEWRVSPFWPLKLPFLVIGLEAEEYRYTVIAGPNRDWLWIMARDTQLPAEDWKEIETLVRDQAFDFDSLRRVPHRWPTATTNQATPN